jgi:hypothetical protein
LLYWDKIYRLVPENYEPPDSEFVQEAIDKKLIENIEIDERYKSCTQDLFFKFLEDEIEVIPEGYSRYFQNKIIAPVIPRNYGSYIDENSRQLHMDKVSDAVLMCLREIKFFPENDWFRLPSDWVKNYMLFLATYVSTDLKLPIVTDNETNWLSSAVYTQGSNLATYKKYCENLAYDNYAHGYYSTSLIRNFLPTNMQDVTLDRIMDFRTSQSEQRRNLKSEINRYTAHLSGIRNKEVANEELNGYCNEIEYKKREFIRSIENMGLIENLIGSPYKGLQIGLSVGANVIGALIDQHGPLNYYTLGTTIVNIIAVYYCDYLDRRRHHQTAFPSYLVNIENNFENVPRV